MRKATLGSVLLVAFLLVTTPSVHATPAGAFLFDWLLGKGLDALWDAATGAPDVREMQRQLTELERLDRTHAEEIVRLKYALSERMTRAEFKHLLRESLSRVDTKLAALAARVESVEAEAKELKVGHGVLRERLATQEGKSAVHDKRLGTVEKRVDRHEQVIQEHERRLLEIERTVGLIGVSGFEMFRKGDHKGALAKFDEAIANDPGDPGYHYGKGLALYRLGRTDEAARSVRTATFAENTRRTAQWYRVVLERVQGPDRAWLEDTRRALATAAPGKVAAGR